LISSGFKASEVEDHYEHYLKKFESIMKVFGVVGETDMQFFAELIKRNSNENGLLNTINSIPQPQMFEIDYSIHERVNRKVWLQDMFSAYGVEYVRGSVMMDYSNGDWSPWDGTQYDSDEYDSDSSDFEIDSIKEVETKINEMSEDQLRSLRQLIEIKLRSL
jgi:hypothetical protein